MSPQDADLARRDRAIELLSELLNHWDPEAVSGIAEISSSSHESPLETRFRQSLRGWLDSRSVAIAESVETGGDRWDFRLPGSAGTPDVSWTLRQEVPLGGCRPDFLLTTPSVKAGIAVFLDGVEFHASVAHNRIADDAAKRRALRGEGYLVWAVTHEDLDGFTAAADDWDQVTILRPHTIGPQRWATTSQRGDYLSVARKLAGAAGGGSVAPEALSGDAMTLLVRVLQQPDVQAWRQAARAATVALVGRGGLEAQLATGVAQAAAVAAAGGPPAAPAGDGVPRKAAIRTSVHGAGLVFLAIAGKQPVMDAVLAVDDRVEVIGSPAQLDAWRDWLALSNVLQLGTDGSASFDAVATTEPAGAPAAPVEGPAAEPSPLEATAARLLDEVDASCHGLVRRLSASAIAEAEPGFETDDGIPLELAWPGRKVAILVDVDPDVHAWLQDHGWTWATAEDEQAVTVLAAAGLIEGSPAE